MTYREPALFARRAAAWCFPLLGLAIPVSTALDSILVAAIVLAWLAALPHDFTRWRVSLTAVRPITIATALFALIVGATLYSDVSAQEAWGAASKYMDLFLISVLLWAAHTMRSPKPAIYTFLSAVVLNLVVSYLVANSIFESIPGLHSLPEYPVGFKRSVTHGIFVAFGAFVFLLLARDAKTTATRAPLIGLAILCAHNVLVMVIGRTGYLVLGILLAYLVVTATRSWKSGALAFVVAAGLFAGAYQVSGNLQERIASGMSDLAQWTPGAADKTSVGQRMEYALTTSRIIRDHPLGGVGTGGFAAAYREASRSSLVTSNPHNDYLMIGAQVGLAGIALLVALYALLWRDASKLGSRFERDLLRGLVLTMAAGGLFNSLLLDHAEGLWFAWMTALAYALGRPGRHTPVQDSQPMNRGPASA